MAKVIDLKFDAGGFKLDIPNWEFSDQGITAIWGPSGSGKSTLLNILAGLVPHKSLTFQIKGTDYGTLPAGKRKFGFVFQDYGLFPHLTIWQNLEIACNARNVHQWETFAKTLLEQLSIYRLKDRVAGVLSGGEKQRVALARALAIKPELVLLDEPLSALDQSVKEDSRELIKELANTFKIPFLLVTHDFIDLSTLASEVLVIKDGRSLGQGPIQKLLDSPPSIEFALCFPIFQILTPTTSGNEPTIGNYPLKPAQILGKNKILAKNWSFEVRPGDGGNIENISIISSFGPVQNLKVKIRNGPWIKCITYMDPGRLAQTHPNKLDLIVNNNSLIYVD